MQCFKIFNIVFLSLFWLSGMVEAQVKDVYKEIKKIEFNIKKKVEERRWKYPTRVQINFGQQYYDHWVGGDVGKLEVHGKFSQKVTYQNQKILWNNDLDILYGINKNHGEILKKSSDQITLNSIFGKKVNEKFSYSYFLNLQTQLTNTYLYDNDTERNHRLSGFLAPLYVTTGPGVMWRKGSRLAINIAPASLKLTYLNGIVYEYNKKEKEFFNSKDNQIYGVEAGENINYKWGFYAHIYIRYKIFKSIEIDNKLSLYSNYLENPKNIDLDNTLNINFKINKLLTTNLVFQTIYDDDVFSGFQLRQHFGVGFNFKL